MRSRFSHFPGSETQEFRIFTDLNLFNLDFLMKSGRAVMFPVYRGTYERMTHPTKSDSNEERDETSLLRIQLGWH
jgi:hypothetical protein